MVIFVARRLIGLLITLLVTSFLIFGAIYLAPGSPLSFLVGGKNVNPQQIAEVKARYHLDAPFPVQYWDWLTAVLHGDFGRSLAFKDSVGALIEPRVATTLTLVVYASVLIMIAGVALGLAAGLGGERVSAALGVVTTVGLATPGFVAAIVLITLFAVDITVFPVFGSGSGIIDRLWHLTLPSVALALSGSALVARVTGAAVREERVREHVETARSRGIPGHLLVLRHVLRNALVPITTVGGVTTASLIAGAVVIENAFQLDGLGSLLVRAVAQKDFAVVQAISLILVAAFVVINTAVDVLYTVIDPRLQLGEARS